MDSLRTGSQRQEEVNGVGPRYDVRWIGVLAVGLLILHHAALAFVPWSTHLFLIWNKESWIGITRFTEFINPWGLPLLFVASGMVLRLALDRRNARQIAGTLSLRVVLPLVFGTAVVGPLSLAVAVHYFYGRSSYVLTPAHLWFLGNLLIYVLLLLPLLLWGVWRPDNGLLRATKRLIGSGRGFGLVFLAVPLVLEAIFTHSPTYVLYPFRLHGLITGLLCFALGFLFVSTGDTGRDAVRRLRFGALIAAAGLALARLVELWHPPYTALALEAMTWIVALWGFAVRYLDKPSRILRYLSGAAFPVYILHLPVQLLMSSFLMRTGIHPLLKFLILSVLTIGGSVGLYELIKRIPGIRLLFGIGCSRSMSPREVAAEEGPA
jgi:hypothetical protein